MNFKANFNVLLSKMYSTSDGENKKILIKNSLFLLNVGFDTEYWLSCTSHWATVKSHL